MSERLYAVCVMRRAVRKLYVIHETYNFIYIYIQIYIKLMLTRSRSCVLCSAVQTLLVTFDLGNLSRFILPKLF